MSYYPRFATALLGTNIARGAYVVGVSWTALSADNEMAAVGQVLLAAHLATFFLSPYVGGIIDRRDRRMCASVASVWAALVFGGLALLCAEFPDYVTTASLLVFSFCAALAALFVGPSEDAVIQALTPKEERHRIGAQLNILRQAGMVTGAGLAGWLVAEWGSATAFALCAAGSLVSAVVILALPKVKTVQSPNAIGRWASIAEGLKLLSTGSGLATALIVAAFAVSVGQVTNALLPAFIKLELGQGSGLYGAADAAWSVGALAAAFLTGLYLRRRSEPPNEIALLAILGLCNILFALTAHTATVVAMHAVLGASFSLVKVVADGRIMMLTPTEYMGRVRSNLASLTSFVAIGIYIAPTLLQGISAQSLYIAWGGLVIVLSIGLLLMRQVAARRSAEGLMR
ncbi:MAG: MFS transporter [Brucellaceae bacterium]|nr:MFS transporter [Brucellaceae bacterium]